MTRKAKGCSHCWHVTSSVTNGLDVKGWDNVMCCWCGVQGTRDWEIERSLRHGPHAKETETIYEPVVIGAPKL